MRALLVWLQVVSTLATLQTAAKVGAPVQGASAALASAYGHALAQQAKALPGAGVAQRTYHQEVTPVVPKLRAKLFTPPRTLHSFFSKPAVGLAGSQRSAPSKGPSLQPAAPAVGKAAAKRTSQPAQLAKAPVASLTQVAPLSDVVDLCDSLEASKGAAAATGGAPCRTDGIAPASSGARQDGSSAAPLAALAVAGACAALERPGPADGAASLAEKAGATSTSSPAESARQQASTKVYSATPTPSRESSEVTALPQKRPRSSDENEGVTAPASAVATPVEPLQARSTGGAHVLEDKDLNEAHARAALPSQAVVGRTTDGGGGSVGPGSKAARAEVRGGPGRSAVGSAARLWEGKPKVERSGGKEFSREEILAMGFRATDVDVALKITRNDGARAIEYLLTRTR